ncbi:hypothetical protein OUZ56_006646 [Daphnia magna]|uniref:Anaphase-promoting complex subunit 4-like WD40 domain-containing protein n=1 Tax=Daphnia magna TaxID=35525 RepID=A0ABQ9YW92_9CRUS|nr:hypothetical protein OUZ56_006646 [Daphnia magna]
MPVEFTISSKNLYDAGLQVSKCSFHPSEPVLACAIDGGKICLYHKQHTEFKGAAELIVPLSQWNETVLNPVPTQYPVSGISCLQWDVEGKRLAVGYENGTLILWSRDGCRLFERRKHTSRIWSIRWNPILLNVFASGSNDRSALVWDADKKPSPLVQRFVAHDGDRIHDVVWISEIQFASFSRDQNDGIVHICQIGRETPIMTFVHGDSIEALKWNGRFNLLASVSSSSDDRLLLQVWSPSRKDPIRRLNYTNKSRVGCIDWFPPGRESDSLLIVGGCADGSLIVWNLNDDEDQHQTLYGHSLAVNDVSFSPDRRWLASVDQDGYLIIRLTTDWRKAYEAKTGPNYWHQTLSWSGSSDKLAVTNVSSEVFVVEILH